LKNASALDVVALVNRVLAENTGAPGAPVEARERVALVADPRSNGILVRADNPARGARVRQLIEQLDTPSRPGGNVFIVYLKNAEAAQVAETLRGLYGGEKSSATAPVTTTTSVPSALPGAVATTTTSFGASSAATSPLATSATGATSTAFAAGGAMIQADTANNALIIMAAEPVYNNLRSVIERLDTRRAQVFVEALIVEVSSDKAAEFGIQWQVLTGARVGQRNLQGIGGTNFGARGSGQNIIDASVNLGSLGNGLNLGIINGTITIPGLGVISNLGLLVRALENDSSANILSTPTLLTLDNEEARIIVGQNVPFITGQYATTGTTATVQPFQTIERRDVGLVLRVRPQITEGGSVRLGLYQEVSRVQDTSSAGPILSKRALESSVVVDDQQIVVLGGLIQDSLTDGTEKLPYAGDLPGIGSLFRYDNRSREKTNLMIFLKPTIVRGTQGGREITSERYDYLRGEQLQNVPFITGQYATTGTTATVQPFQTIERRDVGLVLRVRPQITEGGSVRLGLYQEVSRVQDTSSAGPILSKRALESSVVVDDQQIVVLGGLIQDSFNDGTQKLPYAGDLPGIGSLFRYDNRSREKTNLMIFLKPTIVRGTQGGREITSERYDYLRGEQLQNVPESRWFWKDPTVPELPPHGAMPGSPQAVPSGEPAPDKH
jgi:general secretion pathway protein D